MFDNSLFYTVNREERHFGFLLFASVLYDINFRESFVLKVNELLNCEGLLKGADLDIYAEVALFRDYWNSFGAHKKYSIELHNKRLEAVQLLLKQFNLNLDLIEKYDCFWTKEVGQSKLWYPGKWNIDKMKAIQIRENITENKLLRIRWACNAKPDIMLVSNNNVVFVELKVESGLGDNSEGYDQKQTQLDIIDLAKISIPFISSADHVERIMIVQRGEGLLWSDLISEISNPLVKKHFEYIPS